MSLVCYADSDDSGEEDIRKPGVQKKYQEIENKEVKPSATHSPTTLPVDLKEAPNSNIDTSKPKSIGSLFSSLPAPWISTVSWANKSSCKQSGKTPKNREQTVLISLPTFADDSDSDDEGTVRKNITPASGSQKPAGLFSFLPKPKHSVVVKENNPNRPVTKISNRALIPDSLRRKQVKKPTPQAKKDDSDDDSDDGEGGSFFSWHEQETATSKDALAKQVTSEVKNVTESVGSLGERNTAVTQTQNILPSTKSTASRDAKEITPDSSGKTQETSSVETPQLFSQPDKNKHSEYFENKTFYTDNVQGYTNYPVGYQINSENPEYSEPIQPYYDYCNSEEYNQAASQQEQTNPDWQPPAQPTVEETPDQLKRFLGKRGRGEENIDIIDVNADDQVGSSQEWKTNYQKEDADYKPQSKKKDNLPSSQQRRKHQITYLAFQAKEKEWELRNQWSANRQTRRQTQSKYGF